ncbi:hypothetical protein ACVIHI_009022 [Bradyrhizobium sp. USDA 4524]|nr:hypothetical protein [Bradyrhizobium sp. USDA 4538]MCP1907166.1 hypothetical protein [Bradyrhizobium sp. USDA 4537]MCP1985642.1 hypothetical protein [Bradyrhizobium sp. USDA 4539]
MTDLPLSWGAAEAKRLKALEEENAELKTLFAEKQLEAAARRARPSQK